jgi:hypothetical protein
MFASVAVATDQALADSRKKGGPRREQQRDVASRTSSAPNPKIAEALERVIDGALAFGDVPGAGGSPAAAADKAGHKPEESASIRLFRKGPAVSKKALERLEKQTKGANRPPAPPKAVDRLPKHRQIDARAVFDTRGATRGIVVDGKSLLDALDVCKKREKKERDEEGEGKGRKRAAKHGVVVETKGKIQLRREKRNAAAGMLS